MGVSHVKQKRKFRAFRHIIDPDRHLIPVKQITYRIERMRLFIWDDEGKELVPLAPLTESK